MRPIGGWDYNGYWWLHWNEGTRSFAGLGLKENSEKLQGLMLMGFALGLTLESSKKAELLIAKDMGS